MCQQKELHVAKLNQEIKNLKVIINYIIID